MKWIAFAVPIALLFAACGREEPVTYRVQKESVPVTPSVAVSEEESVDPAVDVEAVQAAHKTMAAQVPAGPGFTSTLPVGWSKVPVSGIRMASYAIAGTSIDFYMIPLSMGDVPSNVNRWRGQIGLTHVATDEIEKEIKYFQVDGRGAKYIEIYNDRRDRGIIAAIVDLAPEYWYFTAKGSAGELKDNASAIRAFLESVKIN